MKRHPAIIVGIDHQRQGTRTNRRLERSKVFLTHVNIGNRRRGTVFTGDWNPISHKMLDTG